MQEQQTNLGTVGLVPQTPPPTYKLYCSKRTRARSRLPKPETGPSPPAYTEGSESTDNNPEPTELQIINDGDNPAYNSSNDTVINIGDSDASSLTNSTGVIEPISTNVKSNERDQTLNLNELHEPDLHHPGDIDDKASQNFCEILGEVTHL